MNAINFVLFVGLVGFALYALKFFSYLKNEYPIDKRLESIGKNESGQGLIGFLVIAGILAFIFFYVVGFWGVAKTPALGAYQEAELKGFVVISFHNHPMGNHHSTYRHSLVLIIGNSEGSNATLDNHSTGENESSSILILDIPQQNSNPVTVNTQIVKKDKGNHYGNDMGDNNYHDVKNKFNGVNTRDEFEAVKDKQKNK